MKNLSQKTILTSIKNALACKEGIIGVVVFGSIAREDFNKTSDIDVFIITEEKSKYNFVIDQIASIKSKRPIQPVVRSLDELEKTDDTLLKNVLKEGKILYWNGTVDIDITKVLKLNPYIIISFNLGGLKQTTKVRFNYELYGKRKQGGILRNLDGERIGKSSVVVPDKYRENILKVFKSYFIEYKTTDIWK